MREPAPSNERLSEKLGRQARQRPPMSRAKQIAWIVFAVVVVALLIFGRNPPWVDRLKNDKLEEQRRERQEREERARVAPRNE